MNYENKTKYILDGAKTLDIPESLIKYVTDNPKFALWSGSSKQGQHHYGTGGLQYHTWEVLTYSMSNSGVSNIMGNEINQKILFLAALYHDVGKMWDYAAFYNEASNEELNLIEIRNKPDSVFWKGVAHKRSIHHISRSAIEWTRAVAQTGECKDIEDAVLHCILSHHGTREWGSPVAPKSREAWMLFLCDGISARINDANTSDMIGRVKSV